MSELEELLQRETALATYESTGVFSLALAEARKKLAQFQLGSLNQAVLKLLQALIQLEPAAIWMESDEGNFVLNWAEPRGELEPRQFVGNLEKVMLGPECPAKDFAIGLLAFLHCEPTQVWWSHWQGSQALETTNLFGGQTRAKLRPPPSLYRTTFSLTIQCGTRPLEVERQEIATRCLFAPLLILWNGRLLCERSWNPPGHRAGQVYWGDFYFLENGPISQGIALKPIGPCRKLVEKGHRQQLAFDQSETGFSAQNRYILGGSGQSLVLKGQAPRLKGLAHYLTPASALGSSQVLTTALGQSIWIIDRKQTCRSVLLCVKHGILLDPLPMPLSIKGVMAVVATPELEVDLSQFTPVVGSPGWLALLGKLGQTAAEVVKRVERDVDAPYPNIVENIPGDLCLAGVAGAIAGCMTLPFVPFYVGGLIGGLGGFFGLKATIETVHRLRNDRLKQGLQELTRPRPKD